MRGIAAAISAGISALCCTIAAMPSHAGTLSKADIEARFPAPLVVGEKNTSMPVWPIFARAEGKLDLQGYAFESVDFEPAPGYAGKPINHLIAIDPKGRFLAVKLIEHVEPIFRGERGTKVLAAFAAQYEGLTIHHNIQIYGHNARTSRDETSAGLHGVAAGTISSRAMDRSIIESAIAVANAQVQADGNGRSGPNRSRQNLVERHSPMSLAQMAASGMVQTVRFTRAQVEAPFASTRAAGKDERAAIAPDELNIEFNVALASIPQIGRNLLDAAGWSQVRANARGSGYAFIITEHGPLAKMNYESQRVRSIQPFVLRQGGQELKLRNVSFGHELAQQPERAPQRVHVVPIETATPFDPHAPFELAFQLERKFGEYAFQRARAEFPLAKTLPDARSWIESSYEPAWMSTWRERAWELVVLGIGLVILTAALLGQRWLSVTPGRLNAFRVAALIFTLGFIGWYAQAQLTIVNITAAIEALAAGADLSFMMFDPPSVVLWLFVIATLIVWGRGTFCGWLCPFGALQELISLITQRLGLKPRRFAQRIDARLKWIKYAVLAGIGATLVFAPGWTGIASEVEPFKTAISLYFLRSWPYVVFALACVALSVFVYRGYCRYVCPLGAALALFGKLRVFAWLPRREACGTPCQTCRHRCQYQSIEPAGKVAYSECFQCLDCVAIYQDEARCLPLVRERKPRAFPVRVVGQPA